MSSYSPAECSTGQNIRPDPVGPRYLSRKGGPILGRLSAILEQLYNSRESLLALVEVGISAGHSWHPGIGPGPDRM